MRTRGVRESSCRVCNGVFKIPGDGKPLRARTALWFSLKARDRLDAYTRAWWQSMVHVFAAERREAARTGARPTVRNALARSGSAKELLAEKVPQACLGYPDSKKNRGAAMFRKGKAAQAFYKANGYWKIAVKNGHHANSSKAVFKFFKEVERA